MRDSGEQALNSRRLVVTGLYCIQLEKCTVYRSDRSGVGQEREYWLDRNGNPLRCIYQIRGNKTTV